MVVVSVVVLVAVGVMSVPTVREAQERVPLPAMELDHEVPAELLEVTEPLTVRVKVELTVKVVAVPEKVSEAQAAFAVTVTVKPPSR